MFNACSNCSIFLSLKNLYHCSTYVPLLFKLFKPCSTCVQHLCSRCSTFSQGLKLNYCSTCVPLLFKVTRGKPRTHVRNTYFATVFAHIEQCSIHLVFQVTHVLCVHSVHTMFHMRSTYMFQVFNFFLGAEIELLFQLCSITVKGDTW